MAKLAKMGWDDRIKRAQELAEVYPFAAEVLLFYSKLTALQKGFYLHLQSTCGSHEGNRQNASLPHELDGIDLALLMPRFRPFLSTIEREGPSALAAFARDLDKQSSGAWAEFLSAFWCGDESERAGMGEIERFCAQAFLQPYAEYLADHADSPPLPVRRPICPFCGARPLVGVLRPEGDGAKRSLVCSFCRTEWDYRRIACPACEESREEKLCVYTAGDFEHVRLEACETCRYYLKTIDMTKNGLAIPEVDELATIPLTLWAEENGYRKLTPNLLRV